LPTATHDRNSRPGERQTRDAGGAGGGAIRTRHSVLARRRGSARAPVGPGEPFGQQLGRLVRRRAIERHHRRRDARRAEDVRPPAIAGHTGDFNLKNTSVDRLAQMHDSPAVLNVERLRGRGAILGSAPRRSSESRREAASTFAGVAGTPSRRPARKYLRAHPVHRFCTDLPHDLHSGNRRRPGRGRAAS